MLSLLRLGAIVGSVAKVVALSSAELSSVFPSTAELQGSFLAPSSVFELSVVTNSTHGLFVLNATSTSPHSVGWLAIGLGNRMSNSDYLVAWPTISDSSVSWTLSHRSPDARSAHNMPVVASTTSTSNTAAFFYPVTSLTTTTTDSPFASVAWIRQLSVPAGYPVGSGVSTASMGRESLEMIYASSSHNPGAASESATLQQHNQPHGAVTMNISLPINLASATPISPQPKPSGLTSRDKVLIVHAAFGSAAAMVVAPAGVLCARLGRGHKWYPVHATVQAFAIVCIVIAFALGVAKNTGGVDDSHKQLGIALFILYVVVQPGLGYLGHRYAGPSPITSARPAFAQPAPSPIRLLHVVLGVVILALGWWQVWSGLNTEWQTGSDRQDEVPLGAKVVFWIVVGSVAVLYLGWWVRGVALAIKERRNGGTRVELGSSTSLEMSTRFAKPL
ncbi:hypothetical protein JCM1840_003513 [Sporobolomyces johnsonii]